MTEEGLSAEGPSSAYLASIRARAHELVPGLQDGTSYGMPALKYRGRGLMGVLEHPGYLSYYPFSPTVIETVAAELRGFSFSKGTVRFSLEQPLPAGIVDRMILARRDEIDAALDR
jgi:uncharacterized protein YdhG (YjbR/CyaY superfamily)